MNNTIRFTYKDVPYTLEYDRNTIRILEENGLSFKDIMSKPMSSVDILFKGAFLKNHRNTKDALIDEIYGHMTNKEQLIQKLISMVNDCYTTLLEENENDEGNIKWDTTDSL